MPSVQFGPGRDFGENIALLLETVALAEGDSVYGMEASGFKTRRVGLWKMSEENGTSAHLPPTCLPTWQPSYLYAIRGVTCRRRRRNLRLD